VPLHFSAFHPDWKMTTSADAAATLSQARRIALDAGLHYVFTGNVHERRRHHLLPELRPR
jgi:pyruvate formate lyase activating enzyme